MLSVNNINNSSSRHVAFQSKIIPNKALEKGFAYAEKYPESAGRSFVRAIKSILNDGKDDVYKITTRHYGSGDDKISYANIYKNGEKIPYEAEEPGYLRDGDQFAAFAAIKEIAPSKLESWDEELNYLTKEEMEKIQTQTRKMQKALYNPQPTFLHKIDKYLDKAKELLEKNTLKDLKALKTQLFNTKDV